MIEVTLKYGLTKQATVTVRNGATIREVLGNSNAKALLGYPESVSAVIDGVTVDLDESVADGDTIVLEKQAAAKAA